MLSTLVWGKGREFQKRGATRKEKRLLQIRVYIYLSLEVFIEHKNYP